MVIYVHLSAGLSVII